MGRTAKAEDWYPADELRIRGWTRDVKRRLLPGSSLFEPEAADFIAGLASLEIGDMQASTISNWWGGKHKPNSTYQTLIAQKLPDFNKKWFDRSLGHDRLQCHLCALDLLLSRRNTGALPAENRQQLAYELLHRIHQDWHPRPYGGLEIPGPVGREGIRFSLMKIRQYTDIRTRIPFSTTKGPRSELSVTPDDETEQLFRVDDPSSIIPFLLRYAATSKTPDPGLLSCLTLDFTTAVIAYLELYNSIGMSVMPRYCGRAFTYGFRLFEIMLQPEYGREDPAWVLNDPLICFGYDFEKELGAEMNELWDMLRRMLGYYNETLATLGISREQLIEFIDGNPIKSKPSRKRRRSR